MKQTLITFFVILLFSTVVKSQNSIVKSIQHGGINREYRIYIPASYSPNKKVPVVFNLHGFGSNGEQQELYTKFNNVADTANIIIVYPNASPTDPITNLLLWNFGIMGMTVDDVSFLEALIDTVASHYAIDENRLYSCGISAGATMSYYMACHSDRFAAIGSVAGGMSRDEYINCQASYPMPVIDFRGTADGIATYDGDMNMQGIEDILSFWINENNCNPTPIITNVPDINPNDGATAEHRVYSGGIDGHSIEFFKIIGGGHTWPGASVTILGMDFTLPNGNTCMDFDGTAEMWRFFRQFSKNSGPSKIKTEGKEVFHFFPNPAENIITIQTKAEKPIMVELTDVNGKIIQKSIFQKSGTLDISSIKEGIYFLKIGEQIEKIVIQ